MIGTIVRELVPPQLDFVVLVYRPEGPLEDVSHVIGARTTPDQIANISKERAAEAARVFAIIHGGPRKPAN